MVYFNPYKSFRGLFYTSKWYILYLLSLNVLIIFALLLLIFINRILFMGKDIEILSDCRDLSADFIYLFDLNFPNVK